MAAESMSWLFFVVSFSWQQWKVSTCSRKNRHTRAQRDLVPVSKTVPFALVLSVILNASNREDRRTRPGTQWSMFWRRKGARGQPMWPYARRLPIDQGRAAGGPCLTARGAVAQAQQPPPKKEHGAIAHARVPQDSQPALSRGTASNTVPTPRTPTWPSDESDGVASMSWSRTASRSPAQSPCGSGSLAVRKCNPAGRWRWGADAFCPGAAGCAPVTSLLLSCTVHGRITLYWLW